MFSCLIEEWSDEKKKIMENEFMRNVVRHGIPFQKNDKHPIDSNLAQNFLAAIKDNKLRIEIAQEIFLGKTMQYSLKVVAYILFID